MFADSWKSGNAAAGEGAAAAGADDNFLSFQKKNQLLVAAWG